MLGIFESHPAAASAAAGHRGTKLTLLALAASAAAFFAVAGTAQAQDCVGGWRMINGEIPVACSEVFGRSAFAPLAPFVREPLTTGSINRERPPSFARLDESAAVTTSSSGQECVGGYSYRETPANGWTLPMRCN
jgi:hypothetical protein